ncbi:hypothetical protein MFIFM68171_06219 [Madurella fahalii]|uniref:Uncharacterized protein n=1 Tax=Madurella fahalii TaxID=1157608 RepID=A0ABQ0GE36_9PEZI
MVITRSKHRTTVAADDESSSGDSDIPDRPVRRREASAQTPATLRPQKRPQAAGSDATKRKRNTSVTSSGRKVKRLRDVFDEVKESIQARNEDEGEDEDEEYVDGAVIEMMNAASKPRTLGTKQAGNIEVVLSTSGSRTTAPSEILPAGRSERRPRARRLNRRANAIEFIGLDLPELHRINHADRAPDTIRETPQQQRRSQSVRHRGRAIDKDVEDTAAEEKDEEEIHSGFEHSTTLMGSPELQSSATKRRASQAAHDVYNVPEDPDPPTAVARRPPTMVNGLPLLSRVGRAKKPARKASISRNNARLASIYEEEAVGPPRHDPLSSIDEGDQELERLMRLADGSEESESEVSWQADSAGGQHATADNPSVAIQIPPNVESCRTMTISSDYINNMRTIMGWRGWTGAGRSWDTTLVHPGTLGHDGDGPVQTRLGKGCFKSLRCFKSLLEKVPSTVELPKQNAFLAKEGQALNNAMSSIDRVITKICDEGRAAAGDSGSRFRKALAKDLSSCLIPMLVLVQGSAFTVGIVEDDDDDDNGLLPGEGVFTWSTVQYLLWIAGWMLRLEAVLMSELSRPGSGSRHSDPGQATSQEDALSRVSRQRFGVMLRNWKQHLRHAVDNFNEQVERDRDRLIKKQQDEAIKEAKRKAEEEELARSQEQHCNWELSIQRVVSRPRPLVEKWRKATQNWNVYPPLSTSQVNGSGGSVRKAMLVSGRGSGSGTQSRPLSLVSSSRPSPAPSRPTPTPPPVVLGDLYWDEDDVKWFLAELQRPDRRADYLAVCAETLDLPLDEVRNMRDRLKREGRYQSPGR